MKFAAIALLATTVSAAKLAVKTTCTAAADCNKLDDTDNCCGYYLTEDKKTVTRVCGLKAGTVIGALTAEAKWTFKCTELKVEGASKLALGLSAVAAALYMA